MTELSRISTQRSPADSAERTNSGRFSQLDPDKLRGGYYTSENLARWLCKWAIRDASDVILEPSCGDGAFLLAATDRLAALGAKGPARANRLFGIEILSDEADKACQRLRSQLGHRAADVVETSDFLRGGAAPTDPCSTPLSATLHSSGIRVFQNHIEAALWTSWWARDSHLIV